MSLAVEIRKNHLLACLKDDELARWLPSLEAVEMPLGQVLYESGRMLGEYVSLGIRESPLRAVVQGSGQAWQVPTLQFCRELPRGHSLRRSVNRCLYVRMAQLAGWSACVRFHSIGPRPACWLLMCLDRADVGTFTVTHQALGHALGVRRVGVTQAAGILQRAGLISYRRGEITVLKRRDLERAACSCYLADRARYESQL